MSSTDQNSSIVSSGIFYPMPSGCEGFSSSIEAVETDASPEEENWRCLFHSYDEVINAPPLRFAIEGFLPEDGITLIGGPAGHGKTFLLLSMVKALLTGEPLLGYFEVPQRSKRVLYLIPESGLRPFKRRLELFGLCDFVKDNLLFVRTLSTKEPLYSLADPRLKAAAIGADVFLDTVIRFMSGDENSSSDNRTFASLLFALQSTGARTICGAHHSPKGFAKEDKEVTLENALRGAGDIGAMLSAAWAIKQIDQASNRVLVQNVKARDFEACEHFVLEGRPHIDDTGSFKMFIAPGDAEGEFWKRKKGGNDKHVQAKRLKADGCTDQQVAKELGVKDRTIRRWRKEGHLTDTECPEDTES